MSLAIQRVLTVMCFLHSPELDSPKPYTKRRALRILSILRWALNDGIHWNSCHKLTHIWIRDLTHVCPSERWPRNLWMQHTRLRGKRLAKNAESVQEEIVREREQQAPDQTRLLQQRRGQIKGLLKNPAEEGWSATKLENAATLCRNISIERSSYQDGAVPHLCSCLASWQWEQLCLCYCAGRPGPTDKDGCISGKRVCKLYHTCPETFHTCCICLCMGAYSCVYLYYVQ